MNFYTPFYYISDTGNLYVLNTIDSSQVAVIKDVPSYYNISWSPESNRFLFNRTKTQLFIYDLRNKMLKIFGEGTEGAWSPCREEIACRSSDGRYLIIYSISAEIISSFKVSDPYRICWSPDGNYLAYFRDFWFFDSGVSYLEISNRNGTAKKVVYEDGSSLTSYLNWVE
ncbi:MAG: hypothetical protein M1536_06700 [Firmicutes bacterium]|nr:hypothetical protein [Bacillota bacterium]